jgi:hypothetical protein
VKAVSAELAAAIEAPDRTLAPDRLFVDWDADGFGPAGSIDDLSGYVTSVSTDGSLQGDFPDDVRIVQGSAARTLTAGLGGGSPTDDSVGTVTYFSPVAPVAPDVPLAGKDRRGRPCYHEVGFITANGPEYVRDFTGVTRNLPVGVGQRAVTVQAVDNRSLVRKSLALPAAAAAWTDPAGTAIMPGLEATWLASYVFAQNGFYASPPPRPGCRMWAPMHGSAQPFLFDDLTGLTLAGDYALEAGVSDGPCRFTDGPFLGALTARAMVHSETDVRGIAAPGGTALYDQYGRSHGRIEFWARLPPGTELSAWGGRVRINDDYEVMLSVDGNGDVEVWFDGNPVANIDTGGWHLDHLWHFVGLWWDRAAGSWIARLDETDHTGSLTPLPATGTSPGEDWDWQVLCQSTGSVAEVHITAGTAGTDPWLVDIPFTPGAVIDRSTNQLVGIVPESSTVDSGQVLKDLAVAERGTAYFDDAGVGRYRTPAALVTAAAQSTQVTVTSRDKITDLQIDTGADRVRNVITCPWVQVTASLGGTDHAYESSSVPVLPGGRVTTMLVDLKGPAFGASLGIVAAANTKADGTGTAYGPVVAPQATATTVGPVTVTVTQLSARSVRIDCENHSLSTIFLVDATGTAALSLSGIYLSADSSVTPATVRDDSSVTEFGEQPLGLPSSPWRQSLAQAVGIASQTLTDTADPQPVITDLIIVGDPRLEYYDRIAVQDLEGSRLNRTYWVRSIKPVRQPGSYLMTLAATATRDVLVWGEGRWGVEVWG